MIDRLKHIVNEQITPFKEVEIIALYTQWMTDYFKVIEQGIRAAQNGQDPQTTKYFFEATQVKDCSIKRSLLLTCYMRVLKTQNQVSYLAIILYYLYQVEAVTKTRLINYLIGALNIVDLKQDDYDYQLALITVALHQQISSIDMIRLIQFNCLVEEEIITLLNLFNYLFYIQHQ